MEHTGERTREGAKQRRRRKKEEPALDMAEADALVGSVTRKRAGPAR